MGKRPPAIAWPAIAWFAIFLAAPSAIVVFYSICERGPYGSVLFHLGALANYARAFDPVYLRVLWNSVWLATLTTVSCLLIGFPLAYVIATSPRRTRAALLMAVVMPFWTNFVVRAYALKVLFAERGPVNHLALAFGLIRAPVDLGNHAIRGLARDGDELSAVHGAAALRLAREARLHASRSRARSRCHSLAHALEHARPVDEGPGS